MGDTTGSSRPRLVAVDIDWKKLLEEWEKRPSKMGVMCYNLPKLGEFGICKTEKHQYPWGFCSPSCGKTTKLSIDHYEDFEEMNAICHEDFPKDSDAYELVPDEVKDCYKCIEAIFPRAINAVFLKDEKGDFEFKTMVQDDKYKSSKGYNHGEFGDSESPLWKETYPEGTNTLDSSEKRHTVVAVYSTGAGLGMVGLMGNKINVLIWPRKLH